MKSLIGFFEHFSIARKLLVGFLSVVLLMLVVATTSYQGLNLLIDRSNKASWGEELDQLVIQTELARAAYRQQPNDQQAQAVQARLNELAQSLTGHDYHFSDAHNLQQLAALARLNEEYRGHFRRLMDLAVERDGVRQTWVAAGNQMVQGYSELEQLLTQTARMADYPLIATESALEAARINQQVALLRFHMRGYILEDQQRHLDAANQILDQIIQATENLNLLGQSRLMEQANRSVEALNRYRTHLGQLQGVNQNIVSERAQLEGLSQTMRSVVTEFVDDQLAKRVAAVSQVISRLLLVVGLAILVALFFAWGITRLIAQPLVEVVTLAQKIAQGDLTSDLASERRDEVGQLIRAMGEMNAKLREVLGHIGESSLQLASATTQLSSSSEQNTQGMQRQCQETDQVAAAINEMAATVQEVAQNAELAALAATEADQLTQAGSSSVLGTAQQIETLADEILAAAESMNQLKEESDRIGGVLDVIKAIAEQTNLLALNAAIEAARAGEAGRGFAVVADEVRSLASRTQGSTLEIEELIAGLQNKAQGAVQMMEKSRGVTDSSVRQARHAAGQLEKIAQSVSRIQGMNQQIATAAEEQSAVAEEINQSVIRVRDIAEQAAEAAHEISGASEGLAQMGGRLQNMMGQFKL
ncbi:methyl-accepting chemotaxis protein [Marinospirillum sp. MEB164]|uniref:Methyl-accepting chemotaxis protein n=1 Tax=Marinospirillum alkalitolerans TaxID=3123374 RepID=A0ABW8PXC6_9GAMM